MSTQVHEHGSGGHAEQGGHDEHGGHASVGFYWMIGGILAVLTAIEVAAYYMELGSVEVPLLLILSAAKFVLVVMFFMHLKFDSKIFTGVFLAGLVLAVLMVTGLVILYRYLPLFQV
jgi:cytochrome c oxidase subunit 4